MTLSKQLSTLRGQKQSSSFALCLSFVWRKQAPATILPVAFATRMLHLSTHERNLFVNNQDKIFVKYPSILRFIFCERTTGRSRISFSAGCSVSSPSVLLISSHASSRSLLRHFLPSCLLRAASCDISEIKSTQGQPVGSRPAPEFLR